MSAEKLSVKELEQVEIIDPLLERKIKAYRSRIKEAHRRGTEKLAEMTPGSPEHIEFEARIKERRRARKKEYRRLLEKAHKLYNTSEQKTRIAACPNCFSSNLTQEQLLISDSFYHCRDCDWSGRWVVEQSVGEFESRKQLEEE